MWKCFVKPDDALIIGIIHLYFPASLHITVLYYIPTYVPSSPSSPSSGDLLLVNHIICRLLVVDGQPRRLRRVVCLLESLSLGVFHVRYVYIINVP